MAEIAIVRYRGDTVADEFTIKDATGAVVDITGYSFRLTVNTLKAPPDTSTQLYTLTGTITNGPGGIVEFAPTVLESDQVPGKYYFDVQMTDGAGRIQTIHVGTYTYKQDLSK